MADDRRCDPELQHPGDPLDPCISNRYALCDRDQVGAPMRIAIAGAGIGGLTLALALHEVGIEAEVFEQASEVRELGVGVNLQPHAIKELAALGLLPALDRTGIRTRRMIYLTRRSQTVWDEPRGIEAGYDVPMFSIHRGKLPGVLYQAAVDRLGPMWDGKSPALLRRRARTRGAARRGSRGSGPGQRPGAPPAAASAGPGCDAGVRRCGSVRIRGARPAGGARSG
jgi:hypothetical protein